MQTKSSVVTTLILALALAHPTTAELTKGSVPSNIGALVSLNQGEQTLAEYRFSDSDFKPYIQVLRSPKGINVLRDRPYDHLHHRGLMFAVNMNDIEFWGQGWQMGSLGQQRYHADSVRLDPAKNSLTGKIAWTSLEHKKTILEEHRTIRLLDTQGLSATLLTWQSTFTVPAGRPIVLWKGDHYHGLGMRFTKEMDGNDTFFFAPDAQKPEHVRGTEHLTRASWAAYHAQSEGQKITVAVFDAPDNPRHRAHWFTMHQPFSYLSATINTYRDPFEIRPGGTTTFRYAIAVYDGHATATDIKRLHDHWLKASSE